MLIDVQRFEYGTNYTVGRLSIDGKYQCFTLEDKVRPEGTKIFGETAIPSGTFPVVVSFSEHFQKELPELLGVPGFAGIRIHSGNTDKDTEGCILVGLDWAGGDRITSSRVAFDKLFEKIKLARSKNESITIWIHDTK